MKPKVSFASRMHLVVVVSTGLFLAGLLPLQQVTAQSYRNLTRNSPEMKRLFQPLANESSQSICRIIDEDGKTLVFGLAVSNDGLIVSKKSEIESAESLRCKFASGAASPIEKLAADEEWDLVLLKTSRDTTAAEFADATTSAGQFVFSADEDGRVLSVGVVVSDTTRFRTRQTRPARRAFLGVECREINDGDGLRVRRVVVDSGASQAGLEPNDVLLKIDGMLMNSRSALTRAISNRQPQQEIDLEVLRDEETITLKATLGIAPARSFQDRWGGGPFSERRFGFPAVIAHDLPLSPQQCGGPILDSRGQILGVNIARALRSATYAIPAREVKEFVERNRPRDASK